MLGLTDITATSTIWGHSSAGRAPAWHAGGQRFESAWLHLVFQIIPTVLKDGFRKDITFAPSSRSLFSQFCKLKYT